MTEFERMCNLLELSWPVRNEIVVCLLGMPGIGKTVAVKQHAQKHGSKMVKIVASRCVPSETVGMTMPDNDNKSMTIYNSMQLKQLQDGDILFLDELLEADQCVLSTLLTLIESREMADGTPLPDIQIIAASNETISPSNLKLNIKQRFMFEHFNVDLEGLRTYIFDTFDVNLTDGILSSVATEAAVERKGNEYNILTQRSLTKLCAWMDSVDRYDRILVAAAINNMWQFPIGTQLKDLFNYRDEKREEEAEKKSQEDSARSIIINMLDNSGHHDLVEEFQNSTMSDLIEMLTGLPDWDNISHMLAGLDLSGNPIESDDADEEDEEDKPF